MVSDTSSWLTGYSPPNPRRYLGQYMVCQSQLANDMADLGYGCTFMTTSMVGLTKLN